MNVTKVWDNFVKIAKILIDQLLLFWRKITINRKKLSSDDVKLILKGVKYFCLSPK